MDLRDVAGARVSGEVPVSGDVVNKLIAERIAQHPQIAAVRVQPQQGDLLAVELVPRARMVPTLRLSVRIERQPQFPQEPTLLLRWSMPAAGPLAFLAAPALSFFNAMPPGIRMDGDRIAVDVAELLRTRGLTEVLGFIRDVAIHTRPGAFLVRFEIGV